MIPPPTTDPSPVKRLIAPGTIPCTVDEQGQQLTGLWVYRVERLTAFAQNQLHANAAAIRLVRSLLHHHVSPSL